MTYNEVLENARNVLAPKCRVCPDCNGIACRGEIPGTGAVGNGRSFTVCREYLANVKIPLDPVHEPWDVDTSVELFGHKWDAPAFVAPIGGMSFNYTNVMTEAEYADAVVFGALDAGLLAFTGDGPNDEYYPSTLPVIKAAGGLAVPTIKPWKNDKVIPKIRQAEETGAIAFSMDVDSAALINLKLMGKPVDPKSVAELKELVECTNLPFIVKGVMTAEAALKCLEAGAKGIVVSNHGGRILEDAPAPCSMLGEIRAAVGDRMTILVDGGIRSGADVFKCIALGADAVLIGRPFAIAAHGGRREGVTLYGERIKAQLKEAMMMNGCRTIKDITSDRIRNLNV